MHSPTPIHTHPNKSRPSQKSYNHSHSLTAIQKSHTNPFSPRSSQKKLQSITLTHIQPKKYHTHSHPPTYIQTKSQSPTLNPAQPKKLHSPTFTYTQLDYTDPHSPIIRHKKSLTLIYSNAPAFSERLSFFWVSLPFFRFYIKCPVSLVFFDERQVYICFEQ